MARNLGPVSEIDQRQTGLSREDLFDLRSRRNCVGGGEKLVPGKPIVCLGQENDIFSTLSTDRTVARLGSG